MVGWVAPSMAVANRTMDCDSVVVCAARDHTWQVETAWCMQVNCHGGLPVRVGWVAPLVVITDSATATEHPLQTFHASLFCVQLFLVY